MEKIIKLSESSSGKKYVVVSIEGGTGISKRLRSMGFVPSADFKVISTSKKAGPVRLILKGSKLALGHGMTEKIFVKEKRKKSKEVVIALAGNPNSGKTTVFNNLTGSRQHVGNYPGVTVEKKEGYCVHKGFKLNLVDLPGTYSLTAYSLEERVARNFLIDEKPDLVVDVVDFSNLERNLYLATQLMALNIPLILMFNMSDVAESKGHNIDIEKLSKLIGIPIVKSIGHRKIGTSELLDTIVSVLESKIVLNPASIHYGNEIEEEIAKIETLLLREKKILIKYNLRWCAIKLLEADSEVNKVVGQEAGNSSEIFSQVKKSIEHLRTIFRDSPETIIADKRYGFISGACAESSIHTVDERHDMSDHIDRVLTSRLFGLPIFLLLIWLVFQTTFGIGEIPKRWMEIGLGALKELLNNAITYELLRSFIVDGVVSGVGAVITFLPNILILFLAIAFLEDSGYMARAAFIMDRIMHKIGLHGKSFIPMLIGFGCTVPAYMASRILENKEDRLITMHINTFMSCGARLPVYILVCGAFWPEKAGNVIFSLYIIGILIAVFTAKLLRATRFKGISDPFVIELPPYRMPTVKGIVIHMWERCWLFVRKAGTVILGISIVMWFLMAFPKPVQYLEKYENMIQQVKDDFKKEKITLAEKDAGLSKLASEAAAERLKASYAGKIGRGLEFVVKPLGFDWKMGIGIFAGIAAKEAIVSTMGMIYNIEDADELSSGLREKLKQDPNYSPLVAYAFLLFILLYIPCMPAVIMFITESGSFKETLFQIGYTTSVAWVTAFIFYQGGRLLGFG